MSNTTNRRVVITGIGAVTPVGTGRKDFWRSLLEGRSGVRKISCFDPDEVGLDVQIAAEVKDFQISDFFPDRRKSAGMMKDMDRVTLFAMAAARLALEDARLEVRKANPERVGTFIGTGVGGLATITAQQAMLLAQGPKRIGVRSVIRMMSNAPAGQVAIEFGARGRAKSDVTACASGLDSLLDAYMYIKSNRADVMISGGAESCIDPLAIASFANMMALSRRNDEPEKASRPFNADRDGFVMGEGAVILILEELQHALNRGAPVIAEIAGGGASCDAAHIVAPDETGEGVARAIREAIDDAGISACEIGYVNAHGTSTRLNDERETLALKSVFGKRAYEIPVSSAKSMVGHLLGAAGPVGAAASALSLADQKVHPTINYELPDPNCDLDYVPNVARTASIRYALVEALGFGGHNTALVLARA